MELRNVQGYLFSLDFVCLALRSGNIVAFCVEHKYYFLPQCPIEVSTWGSRMY